MKTPALLLHTLLITHTASAFAAPQPNVHPFPNTKNQVAPADKSDIPSPQEVQQIAKKITVRITSEKNGGSGVLIAKKGSTYLVLTNAHVARGTTQFQIQAPDGQKYTAKKIDGGFDAKYDLALLQFTSKTKYTLADLDDVASPLTLTRTIYSAGFPFDSKDVRITSGRVSQLSDIPFDDGTQIGYTIDKGKKGIRQGMSGGAILDGRGKFLGINALTAAPISPNYTYNDGSKPLPKLAAQYRQANWGVPVYNFLMRVKPEILYSYNLPKVERQVTPTGFMARLNNQARKMTVRIETRGENGSGVVIAKEGTSYYVLTAKHVVEDEKTKQKFTDIKIITYDQDTHQPTSTIVAEGVDLAVVKFSSKSNYPLAKLGDYMPSREAVTFVGGFPAREKIHSPLWQWQLNPGIMSEMEQSKLQTQDNQSFSNGYDLLYSNISYGGMSGGPVLDTDGNVMGIHGKVDGIDDFIVGQSLGLSIRTFTGLLAELQVKPELLKDIVKNEPKELNDSDAKRVEDVRKNIPVPQENSDKNRWLAYGNQLYRAGKYKQSTIAFDQAITKGEVLKGNYAKALSLGRLGKYELAEIAILKAIKLVPENTKAKYYYFWKYQTIFLISLNKYDAALHSINTAIKLNPQDLILRNEKVGVLMLKRQYKEALAIYDGITRNRPVAAYVYCNRGIVKSLSGDKKGAINDYNEAIKRNANYDHAYYSRGIVRSNSGDKLGGIADYSQAIKINPQYSEAYNNRGVNRWESGDKKGAITDFNMAIKIDPSNAVFYYDRGSIKLFSKDVKGAITDFDRAIELNSRYTRAYINRGKAKSDLGDKKGAIANYTQAIIVSPDNAIAYYNRGSARAELQDFNNAIDDYTQSIKINANDPDAYLKRGIARSALNDFPGAIVDYTLAIKLNPKYAGAYFHRGMAQNKVGDQKAAIDDWTQVIEIQPDFGQAYVLRSRAKNKLGDKQGAIADLNQVIRIMPNVAQAYVVRGMSKNEIGDKPGAIADLTKASELFRQQGQLNMYQQTIGMVEKLKESKTKN
jgi:tetratricopeptide (TPR) repeat protein/S1-C subfamily serine protease